MLFARIGKTIYIESVSERNQSFLRSEVPKGVLLYLFETTKDHQSNGRIVKFLFAEKKIPVGSPLSAYSKVT